MGSLLSSLVSGAEPESVGKGMESSNVTYCDSSTQWKLLLRESSEELVVVDFSASWCEICRLMAPTFRDLANAYLDVKFIRVDVDELKDVAKEFGIQAMPTFVLLKKEKEIHRLIGAKMDELESLIVKNMIVNLDD